MKNVLIKRKKNETTCPQIRISIMHMYTGLVEMSNSPQQPVFPEAN